MVCHETKNKVNVCIKQVNTSEFRRLNSALKQQISEIIQSIQGISNHGKFFAQENVSGDNRKLQTFRALRSHTITKLSIPKVCLPYLVVEYLFLKVALMQIKTNVYHKRYDRKRM